MSTETPPSPEMAKKKTKHKKNKGYTDNTTKKRKREEHDPKPKPSASPPPQPERAKRKSKKHHKAAQLNEQQLLAQHSPFIHQTTSLYLPLSPCAYDFPLQGLCAEHISPLLLTYYPPLKGVVLSYESPRLSEHPPDDAAAGQVTTGSEEEGGGGVVLSKSLNEYGPTFLWLTADFLLFRPKRGSWMEGVVSLQNESLLGLVCYNYFNAVIERQNLPKDWRWVENENEEHEGRERERRKKKKKEKRLGKGGGYFVDGDGRAVEGRVVFRVEDFEAAPSSDSGGGGTVSILGTLLPAAGAVT